MFWNCPIMFSLKRWRNSAETSIEIVSDFFFEAVENSFETSFEIVWQHFRWSNEESRLRRVLKMSYNVFVEAMREFDWDKYWDCLRIYLLKRWENLARTSFETVWQYFRWSDEEVRLRRVLKFSYNVFVEALRQFGWYKFWDRLRMFPLRWWRK